MKSILFISDVLPYPSLAGDSIRSFEFLNSLSRVGDVYLIAKFPRSLKDFVPHAEDLYRNICKRYFLFERGMFINESYFWKFLYKIPGIRGLMDEHHCQKDIISVIEELKSSTRFDVVWIEKTFLSHYIRLFHRSNYKIIINTNNVESRLTTNRGLNHGNVMIKVWKVLQGFEQREYEKYWFSKADQVIAVSEIDAEYFRRIVDSDKVVVIANFIDLKSYQVGNYDRELSIVFTGSLNYSPNVDAVLYFLDQIWPYVIKEIPNIKIYIVGNNPPDSVKQKVDEHVIVTGYVQTVVPYLRKSQVSIVPLRSGGGTRIKILEAMACEIPVVSTSLGCEGLEVENGVHIAIADEPQTFANMIVRLLSDKNLASRITQNASRLVHEKYSREENARIIESLILSTHN